MMNNQQIFSPYRICPIGAHIDHQGGAVLGRTINLGTTLEYSPLDSPEIRITSEQFGQARFFIDAEIDPSHWARYAQAAARVLHSHNTRQMRSRPGSSTELRGMQTHVSGALIGAGLSSSASVGLAYLMALAHVNAIELSNSQLVSLDYAIEHEQLGLQNGILDPMTIVYGLSNALLFMDTLKASASPIMDPFTGNGVDAVKWIVAYSGISRELTNPAGSGFNVRVSECHQAASLLMPGARILSDVPVEIFEEQRMTLPENLRGPAEHYFSETERVKKGRQAWADANMTLFGQLMNQSCESSLHSYKSGSEILTQLHKITSSTPGIYGSRFSGGGYGGCIIALAQANSAENAVQEIASRFASIHPELPAHVFVAETGSGLRFRSTDF